MSEDNYAFQTTSLTTPILTLNCTFINFDGVTVTFKESSKKNLRQLKRRIMKEVMDGELLFSFDLDCRITPPEEIVGVGVHSSSVSELSSQSFAKDGIHVVGGSEQIEQLRTLLKENPSSMNQSRLFCMGIELNNSVSLKQMRLPCFTGYATPIQVALQQEPLGLEDMTKKDRCYRCCNATLFNCSIL